MVEMLSTLLLSYEATAKAKHAGSMKPAEIKSLEKCGEVSWHTALPLSSPRTLFPDLPDCDYLEVGGVSACSENKRSTLRSGIDTEDCQLTPAWFKILL